MRKAHSRRAGRRRDGNQGRPESDLQGLQRRRRALVAQLQKFRDHDIDVLASFIFGLPTDTPATFSATAELAQAARVWFAQFMLFTCFPGTLDFQKWEASQAEPLAHRRCAVTRPWLIPRKRRPKTTPRIRRCRQGRFAN